MLAVSHVHHAQMVQCVCDLGRVWSLNGVHKEENRQTLAGKVLYIGQRRWALLYVRAFTFVLKRFDHLEPVIIALVCIKNDPTP
jgi:hypothetical protein